MRIDGRLQDEAREVLIQTDFVRTAYGSCLIQTGGTRVICTASVEESVPPFLRGQHRGWITAEYAMLPASTGQRKKRDGISKDGRSVEIQRLIGRSLRQAVDLRLLGERTITLDCDVLEADGGTRTASITGAMVALTCAVDRLMEEGKLSVSPLIHQIAAISCGIVDDEPLLDLCYQEDSRAQVDMNLMMNERGEFIELQGTGEGRAYTAEELGILIAYGRAGIEQLLEAQRFALGRRADRILRHPLLVAASGNAHKIEELQRIFENRYTVVPMAAVGFTDDIDETADSFVGNAILKAETVAAATGLPTIADDSGLTVDALNGEPGVYSARYAGEHGNDAANNAKLLDKLAQEENRSAAFHCVLALKMPGSDIITAEGICPGVMLRAPRGENGFGYDPLFFYPPLNKTFAEMTAEEKNAVSHRARASRAMRDLLPERE